MRILAFLLLGTLIFGFAFPAAILIIGLVAVAIFILMLVGILRGGTFRVYTNRGQSPFDHVRPESPPDNPEVIDTAEHDREHYSSDSTQQGFSDEDGEGEVIELPSTALRKED